MHTGELLRCRECLAGVMNALVVDDLKLGTEEEMSTQIHLACEVIEARIFESEKVWQECARREVTCEGLDNGGSDIALEETCRIT